MTPAHARRTIVGLALSLLAALVALAFVLWQRAPPAPEDSARGPDPIALLASDLAALREDLGALGTGMGEKLQELYEELERSAGERDEALRASIARFESELAALRARNEQDTRSLASLQASVDRIRDEAQAALPGGGAPLAQEPVAEATTPAVESGAHSAPATPEVPVPAEPEPSPAPAASAPKKSFLAFELPSQSFAFDQRQSFAVLPTLSRVGFDAKSTLHDFSGVTSAIEGEFEVCLARPAEGCRGRVEARAATLDTGLAARDEDMRKLLAVETHPEIVFDWSAFSVERVDAAAETVTGTAVGKLTLHGTTRDISMPVKVAVDASKRVSIEGEYRLSLDDYGIQAPSQLGLISMEDEVTVWIALRARSLGKKEGG